MGYQGNPSVYANVLFTPGGSPLDVTVPTGATGLYVNWLFDDLTDQRPAGFVTSLLSNTVARTAIGQDGANIGLIDLVFEVAFENLGSPALFTMTVERGFDLNTGGQVIAGSRSVTDQASGTVQFINLRLLLPRFRLLPSVVIEAGRTAFDIALRITHNSGLSRDIRIGDCVGSYHQIERYARDAV